MKCGLLGRHLRHSYSPQIHKMLGDYSYELFEVEPEDLESFLNINDFDGLNVTIPYKKDVIPYCSKLSPQAEALGAVNTIVRNASGQLIGHNTDYFGFASLLKANGISVSDKKVLLLGSGGASATCKAVLNSENAHVVVISRSGENNYSNLHMHSDASLIINTTPTGMYPENGRSPIDISIFPHLEGVIDLIYNPSRTQLLIDAESRGIKAVNGLWMLVAQAKESAQWFTSKDIPDSVIPEIHTTLQKQMNNIILIGMPGCGKSTIGALLAQKSNREFVDADALIVKKVGKSIPEIFAESGERGFRDIETQVLSDVCKYSNLVIATGGGCVTRPENYNLLRQNGQIVWIKRDIAALPTNGRPLSQNHSLEEMYQLRAPLYRAFADTQIENHTSLDDAVNQIIGGVL